MGYEAYFYEPAAGGHGYGKDNKERAGFTALGFTFLKDKIGWAGFPACVRVRSFDRFIPVIGVQNTE